MVLKHSVSRIIIVTQTAKYAEGLCYERYERSFHFDFLQTVPFTEIIPGGLHPGEMIVIQGCVHNDADR